MRGSEVLKSWETATGHRLLVADLDGKALFGARRARLWLGRIRAPGPESIPPLEVVVARAVATVSGEPGSKSRFVAVDVAGPVGCRAAMLRSASGQPRAVLIELAPEAELQAPEAPPNRLLHALSHEIRTPLASLHGFAELMLNRDFADSDRRSYLRIIADESLRLASILKDFIDLERLEAGEGSFEPVKTDFTALVRQTLEGLSEAGRLWLRTPPEAVWAAVDPARMTRGLTILCENALRLLPADNPIEVVVSASQNDLECSLTLGGARIPEEAIPHLFSQVYRPLQANWPRFDGFSMALLQSVVRAHGGELRAENSPPGAVLAFRLPRLDPSDRVTRPFQEDPHTNFI